MLIIERSQNLWLVLYVFYKTVFDSVDHTKLNNDFVGADEFGMSQCLVVGRADVKGEFLAGTAETDASGVSAYKPSAMLQNIQDSLYIFETFK